MRNYRLGIVRCVVSVTPQFLRKFHLYATLFWLALIPPSIIWWRNSLPYLVGVSVYANLAGHFGSWQASRAETYLDESEKV